MKAGGVQFATSTDEARAHAERILTLKISGQSPFARAHYTTLEKKKEFLDDSGLEEDLGR